jgi:hypothetical protein
MDSRTTIDYDFPLNSLAGFNAIYYLMKITNQDMIKVIKGIISVRDDNTKLDVENVATANILYRED